MTTPCLPTSCTGTTWWKHENAGTQDPAGVFRLAPCVAFSLANHLDWDEIYPKLKVNVLGSNLGYFSLACVKSVQGANAFVPGGQSQAPDPHKSRTYLIIVCGWLAGTIKTEGYKSWIGRDGARENPQRRVAI